MSTHLYCVLPHQMRGAGAIPPGLSGVDGCRVRELPVDRVVAWVSDIERGPKISAPALVIGCRLVRRPKGARRRRRSGARHWNDAGARALRPTLSRRRCVSRGARESRGVGGVADRHHAGIRRDDRHHHAVHAPHAARPRARHPGDARAARRAARYRVTSRRFARPKQTRHAVADATDELAERIRDATADVVHRSTVHGAVTPLPFRTISHLVARDDVARYREAIETVRSGREFRFLVTGPRAPYSFCGLGDDSGKHGMNLAE